MSALDDIIRMFSEVAVGTTMKAVGKLARAELDTKNKAIESAIKALRAVVHDRPTAHTDEVWNQINSALVELETLK